MERAIVFATSLIDSNPDRYQAWVDYYTQYFKGTDVDLLLINDGPNDRPINLHQASQLIMPSHLGRRGMWTFPGWKRSFYYGLRYAREMDYDYIAHIESDCGITNRGKSEFMSSLFTPGFYTGWCQTYDFPEAALQIINEPWVLNYYLDRYSCEENWHEDLNFEKSIQNLCPTYILDGDRYEYKKERFNVKYTYLSGCDLTSFQKLFGNEI